MKKIWILGSGRFGYLSVERTVRNLPEARITVVDRDGSLKKKIPPGVNFINGDGINWLVQFLERDSDVDLIIPAVPVHVAVQWLKMMAGAEGYEVLSAAIPESIVAKLPNIMKSGESTIYVSHADFYCPDNCGEPEKYCTITGKSRGEDMFRLLENAGALVIRSHQLYPGVGGIYPADLWAMYDRVLQSAGEPEPVYIATACRCHGVLDGLFFVPCI